jgi:hypothetical protein
MHVSKRGQSLTFTKNVGQGFLIHSTLPTEWTFRLPWYVKVSSQGVMSGKETNHSLGLSPIKDINLALASRPSPETNS